MEDNDIKNVVTQDAIEWNDKGSNCFVVLHHVQPMRPSPIILGYALEPVGNTRIGVRVWVTPTGPTRLFSIHTQLGGPVFRKLVGDSIVLPNPFSSWELGERAFPTQNNSCSLRPTEGSIIRLSI